jgi:hypothetical protein
MQRFSLPHEATAFTHHVSVGRSRRSGKLAGLPLDDAEIVVAEAHDPVAVLGFVVRTRAEAAGAVQPATWVTSWTGNMGDSLLCLFCSAAPWSRLGEAAASSLSSRDWKAGLAETALYALLPLSLRVNA